MRAASVLLLLTAASAAAAPKAGPLPVADSIVGMDKKMERIEPLSGELRAACEKLLSLPVAYAQGRDPDDPALGRSAARAAVDAAGRRLQGSVGEFWHMAETLRVSQAVGFLTETMSGKKPDAGKAAAGILEAPAFPRVTMHLHQLSLFALSYEENAYLAAKARRARERRLQALAALAGLLGGALLAYFVFGRSSPVRVIQKALPAKPTPKPPARLE